MHEIQNEETQHRFPRVGIFIVLKRPNAYSHASEFIVFGLTFPWESPRDIA